MESFEKVADPLDESSTRSALWLPLLFLSGLFVLFMVAFASAPPDAEQRTEPLRMSGHGNVSTVFDQGR